MYYHNSPTVKTIKQLKQSRAADMLNATNSMKLISDSYKTILLELENLRHKELEADQLLMRFPDKTNDINKKMDHNYTIMQNKLEKFLSDN